ncbi:MAG: hypothetical protein NTW60_03415 [Candidatus Wolfebacteria bacterium]|nr:hypothetical protein [Candidatus Wolfebacteria bacterium]
MTSTFKNFIKKLSRILNISPVVGALEVNDFELKFFLFEVILNIPDNNVFTKVFNLPFVDEQNLKSAVALNLQMVSPMDFSSAYSDWQKVGEAEIDGGQIEILSAFVDKGIVSVFSECLRSANFIVAAIEFPGLSTSRFIDFKMQGDAEGGVIFARVASDGLSFGIMKNGNLYFHHFISWPSEKITMDSLEEIVRQETRRIMNFYSGNWSSPIRDFLVISPSEDLKNKISRIISGSFGLPVHSIGDLPQGYNPKSETSILLGNNFSAALSSSVIGDDWVTVSGSAFRGLISRSKDIIISLASVGTEEEFSQIQIRNFLNIWRNIILTTLSLLTVIFFITERFIVKTSEALSASAGKIGVSENAAEYGKLQAQAKAFNDQIEVAKQARSQEVDWVSFISKIRQLAGNSIVIDRIYAPSVGGSMSVTAHTENRNEIINFKNSLAADQRFSEINMPLNLPPSGEIRFTITFKVSTLDFSN